MTSRKDTIAKMIDYTNSATSYGGPNLNAVSATINTTNTKSVMWGAGGGGSGVSVYDHTSTGGQAVWGQATYSTPQPQVLKVEGDAEFEGEVSIRGVKLDKRLDAIEERLGILRPNNDLEGKWEKLKALGEDYRRLEKEILEGESIWRTLKK